MSRILLVEDEDDLAFAVERALARAGMKAPMRARSGREARERLDATTADVALLDLGLPDTDGLNLLPELLARDEHCRIIVLTGREDPRLAVRAIKAGAVDFLVKPFASEELLAAVRRSLDEAALRREVESARRTRNLDGVDCVGSSPAWRGAMEIIRVAAQADRTPVLIEGETGTGKDVASSLVHRWSARAGGPFVAVNAACLPAATLDSELFGHEAGAFTDAKGLRRGLFELAHGGTLFLDELGELPLELQPKLLRVLEGVPFRRLGGEREIRTDVRVVAATNRDLAAMVSAGRFREDLYWRLKVLSLTLPPLRERIGDARHLALHFLGRSSSIAEPSRQITSEALAALEAYAWPGNVRELRNVMERASVLAGKGPIDVGHLPPELRRVGPTSASAKTKDASPDGTADATLEEVVREHVLRTWNRSGQNVTRAAKTLGIGRVALRRHLQDYGVRSAGEESDAVRDRL